MRETRVDLLHLLEDLRDAYPGAVEETVITEVVANALDSGADEIRLDVNTVDATLTVVDNGTGMRRRDLTRYHDLGATTKVRGAGIGFAGVGIKLGLLESDEVYTETARGKEHVATTWRLTSRRRAPWQFVEPAGLVTGAGTAVSLRISNPLSPLVDADFIETCLARHFESLFDPYFDGILSARYPAGIRFVLNGVLLERVRTDDAGRAPIDVRLPRKRKPSAFGYLQRHTVPVAEGSQGLAVSTLGKVIVRGWDWIGITPTDPDRVTGLIEAPALAEALTLNKADFLRTGTSGALYLAYRKAIQQAVTHQLAEWGLDRESGSPERRRAARPVERELENILMDLADDYPLLPALVERRAGGQRRLPIGVADDESTRTVPVAAPVEPEEPGPVADAKPPDASPPETPPEPAVPPATIGQAGKRRPKRRAKYRLNVQFESRPDDPELARVVETTVWVNDAHPAYVRAVASRSTGYHLALATAMALAPLAVEAERERDFVTAFLARWGEGSKVKRRKRKR